MDDPIFTSSFEFVVVLGCQALDGNQPCSIPLPRQSPLGIYEGQHYQPAYEWRGAFLCLRHGRLFSHSPDSIRLENEMRPPHKPVSPMWKIECACGHEDCGALHTIYTARMPGWAEIVSRILKTPPIVPCGYHDLVWREDLMQGVEFMH